MNISDKMLSAMRAHVARLLYDSVIIQTSTLISDGAGGNDESWVAVGTVLGRIDPMSKTADEQVVVASREALTVMYRLTLPHDAPIVAHARVIIGSKTYEIASLSDDHSKRVSRRAIISELR